MEVEVGEAGETRKLAAILAADVVGYSRLMGLDESGTLGALKAHLGEVMEPVIAAHHGRIVKTTGDGVLAEFASVVDAVQCSIEVQSAMPGRNADIAEEQRVEFRIGINLGDVIVEGEDIYGDGVNVAARLEGLAEPGGICISRAARDQVRDKLTLDLEDLGEQTVKNIARPVRAFNVRLEAPPSNPATDAEAPALPDRPSIAVLPFDNMSGDPEQEYFSDGIAEDIITDLSKVSGLFVIARNSSFAYKGKSPNVQEVCQDLGVRTVLEGSVRKAGNRVRVTAQLIDGESGGHLWAERFDRDLEDIFAVQDEVTQEIVSALRVQLSADEKARLGRGGTDNLEAHDLCLKARERAQRFTAGSNDEARKMLERAVELDPDFATAHAELALVNARAYVNQWATASGQALKDCAACAERAVACDDLDPRAHFAAGMGHMWAREHELAKAEAERAIELDPNSAEGYILLATV
ncbi:MAG TPA: adenylate/guanylate cyclase domain-containing protein, partial [Rhodospirillales bacterium]|nr:adenylate/guanylate cyclase domain-containing protein [Rhodospirillales bacterium]